MRYRMDDAYSTLQFKGLFHFTHRRPQLPRGARLLGDSDTPIVTFPRIESLDDASCMSLSEVKE